MMSGSKQWSGSRARILEWAMRNEQMLHTHTTAHHKPETVVWIPRMGVFEMHNAKQYAVGSGVALQTPIPQDTTSQKLCFWIPRTGVFEMHNAKKKCCGFCGGAPNTHTTAHHKPETVFLDTQDGCL